MKAERINIFYKSGKGSAIAFTGHNLKARWYRYTAERAYIIKVLAISQGWKLTVTKTSNTLRRLRRGSA